MSIADSVEQSRREEDAWRDQQRAKCGNYANPDGGCPKCGRHRVMRGDDAKHRCEKCAWCMEDGNYDYGLRDYLG